MIITEFIPVSKFSKFHEILCSTGGRYLRNPELVGIYYYVQYEPGDYKAHRDAWARCVTQIREVRKNQWWRVLLRRFTFFKV